MMTVSEVALRLRVSTPIVYRLCASGRLGHVRMGLTRAIRVTEEQLATYIASQI